MAQHGQVGCSLGTMKWFIIVMNVIFLILGIACIGTAAGAFSAATRGIASSPFLGPRGGLPRRIVPSRLLTQPPAPAHTHACRRAWTLAVPAARVHSAPICSRRCHCPHAHGRREARDAACAAHCHRAHCARCSHLSDCVPRLLRKVCCTRVARGPCGH